MFTPRATIEVSFLIAAISYAVLLFWQWRQARRAALHARRKSEESCRPFEDKQARDFEYTSAFQIRLATTDHEKQQVCEDKELYFKLQNQEDHPGESAFIARTDIDQRRLKLLEAVWQPFWTLPYRRLANLQATLSLGYLAILLKPFGTISLASIPPTPRSMNVILSEGRQVDLGNCFQIESLRSNGYSMQRVSNMSMEAGVGIY